MGVLFPSHDQAGNPGIRGPAPPPGCAPTPEAGREPRHPGPHPRPSREPRCPRPQPPTSTPGPAGNLAVLAPGPPTSTPGPVGNPGIWDPAVSREPRHLGPSGHLHCWTPGAARSLGAGSSLRPPQTGSSHATALCQPCPRGEGAPCSGEGWTGIQVSWHPQPPCVLHPLSPAAGREPRCPDPPSQDLEGAQVSGCPTPIIGREPRHHPTPHSYPSTKERTQASRAPHLGQGGGPGLQPLPQHREGTQASGAHLPWLQRALSSRAMETTATRAMRARGRPNPRPSLLMRVAHVSPGYQ